MPEISFSECGAFPVARFLAFHDVLPEERETLENNLRFLKRRTNVISLDDFFSGRMRLDRINTVITFDDGYKGWIENALPALKKLELPAVFFVPSGFVGLGKDDERSFIESNIFVKLPPRKITGGLTLPDLRTLVAEGFTIGGHTLNHRSLDAVADASTVRREIREDKRRLEEMTGVKIAYFSYPTGAHTNVGIGLVDELRAAGYKGAVTIEAGFNTSGTNPFLLHRDIIDACMTLPFFKARVFGNIDAVQLLKRMQ
jgi:peptidoglycan/xylan/chitin deacetylase (PgdA/CDA1 family)